MSLTAINKIEALKRKKRSRKQKKRKQIDLTSYRDRPIELAEQQFNISFTPEIKRIIFSVRDNRITNVKAGHGLGKSHCCSFLVIWWIYCVRGLVITTAPTFRQVNSITWAEVRRQFDMNKKLLGGRRTETSLKLNEDAYGFGFSTSKGSGGSNAFQGIHHKKLLIIIEEGCGIVEEIDQGAVSCATGEHNRILRVGNPIEKGNSFERACSFDCITLPVWEHPNVNWAYQEVEAENGKLIHRLKPEIADRILKPIHERKDDPVKPQSQWDEDLPRDIIPGAVSIAWIEALRITKGENSPEWVSRVEAEFPGDDVDGIIPKSWLIEARERYDRNPEYWDNLARQDKWRIGVDVADGGGDNHGVAAWRGPVLYKVNTHAPLGDRKDTIRLARDIVEPLVKQLGAEYAIAVDRLGVGAGTLGILRSDGYYATECVFGAEAENKAEYKNRKTELYWQLREGLRLGEIAIAPLGEIEDELFEDLSSVRYTTNTEKQIHCEAKDKTKTRLKRSPDAGDAVIIAGEYSWARSLQGEEIVARDGLSDELRQIKLLQEGARNRNSTISLAEANEYFQ